MVFCLQQIRAAVAEAHRRSIQQSRAAWSVSRLRIHRQPMTPWSTTLETQSRAAHHHAVLLSRHSTSFTQHTSTIHIFLIVLSITNILTIIVIFRTRPRLSASVDQLRHRLQRCLKTPPLHRCFRRQWFTEWFSTRRQLQQLPQSDVDLLALAPVDRLESALPEADRSAAEAVMAARRTLEEVVEAVGS